MKQIRNRLTYANVMSSLAVFLVLGGATAFAATELAKNSVGAKQLKKNAVTAAKIKNNAVTSPKIKANAVTEAKIASNAVTSAKLSPGSVETGKIGDGAVTSGKLALSSVGKNQLDATERSEVVASTASSAFDLVDVYNPASWTTVMSLNLPNGTWVVNASIGLAFGSESNVGCRINQAGQVLAQSGVIKGDAVGVVPGLSGISMTGVASAGQVTVTCGDNANGVSAVQRALVATRAGTVLPG